MKDKNITDQNSEEDISRIPWKLYLITAIETVIPFYLATICMAIFFIRIGHNGLLLNMLMVALFLSVISICAKILYNNLSIAALMLVIPIAPLLALIMVVSLIPILQYF